MGAPAVSSAGARPARRRHRVAVSRCEDGAVSTPRSSHIPQLSAVMRKGEQVTALELFFDLVFVLALAQCTTLIASTPTWEGLLKGLLALGMLWWSWVGYAWLTSVVNPEEGAVRLVMFAAMAAFLVAAFTSGAVQIGIWGLALVLDLGGPFLFGADGWKLVPGHFADRHGAIVIIALGESIVAIGIGARPTIAVGVVIAAVLGVV